jgi:hypothetical protein
MTKKERFITLTPDPPVAFSAATKAGRAARLPQTRNQERTQGKKNFQQANSIPPNGRYTWTQAFIIIFCVIYANL